MFKTRDGRAAYPSYGDWKVARGKPRSKNFSKSGSLWRGLQIKVMGPTKVRVVFAGRNAGGQSNGKVAKLVQAGASQPMLGVSDAELRQIAKHVEATFPARYLDAQRIAQMGFKARNRLAAAQRSLAQAKKLHDKAKTATR